MQKWDLSTVEAQPHHPEVLQSDSEGRSILLLLPAGESLQAHQVHERAWLVVVDGRVDIDQDGQVVEGGPGFLAVFEPNEEREVRAREAARLLLVLAPWPGEGHPSRRNA